MALRSIARSCNFLKHAPSYSKRMQSRSSSGGSGRVLSEEERAAENMYIRKKEKEKLEKLATQSAKPEEGISDTSASGTPMVSSAPVKATSTDTNKNVAVAAAVVTLIASGWWLYRTNKKVEEEETE